MRRLLLVLLLLGLAGCVLPDGDAIYGAGDDDDSATVGDDDDATGDDDDSAVGDDDDSAGAR